MLDKTYNPQILEQRQHAKTKPLERDTTKPPLSLIMPPPNVTGDLHLGHALTFTLQDVWGRFWSMRGGDVLLQPGLDHAGIATQMVVERQLAPQKRQDMGREAFLSKVWEWKETSGGTILKQLHRLGMSADWSRLQFTLDPSVIKAVRKVFVDLSKKELIYRDKRLVNWDPVLKTALSDLEVLNHETMGKLWRIRYPLVSEEGKPDGFLEVATTRPETLFGDQAVAVHPDDPRYTHLIGRQVHLPLTERTIPVIADQHADPEKGTGAVKITPAHDFNDFEVGRRHHLDMLTILDDAGTLNENVPKSYQGIERFQARSKVLDNLKNLDLLTGEEDITHAIPHGDRSGAILEPRLTDQWYLNAGALAKPALEAWEKGVLRFIPENHGETYAQWLRNIQPWCLSRQLWWGHEIPAWYGPDGKVFVAMDLEAAQEQAFAHYGKPCTLTQDPDILDTWFSSALWPFVTLGWPDESPDLKRYYPSNVLITGFDIIFFWVARMVMMGLYFQKEVPFRDVYIHGLIRDAQRQKMSKTKGNVIDPLDLMEHYGADALRFTLAIIATPGQDITFDPQKVAGYRNFITKLWNACRFALIKQCFYAQTLPLNVRHPLNKWLIHGLSQLSKQVTNALESYKFYEAADLLYHFIWGTYCDWYIELSKSLLDGDDEKATETRHVSGWALGILLRLLHPFAPFVTEELWEALGGEGNLLGQPWPFSPPLSTPNQILKPTALETVSFPEAHTETSWLIELMTAVRGLRTRIPDKKAPLQLYELSPPQENYVQQNTEMLERVLRLSTIECLNNKKLIPPQALQTVFQNVTVVIPFHSHGSNAQEKLAKQLRALEVEQGILRAKLENTHFRTRAPQAIVEQATTRLKALDLEHQKIHEALIRIQKEA